MSSILIRFFLDISQLEKNSFKVHFPIIFMGWFIKNVYTLIMNLPEYIY
jgi:hypothetical protein